MDIEMLKSHARMPKKMSKSGQAEPLDSIHDIVKNNMVLPAAFDQLLHLIHITTSIMWLIIP